MLLGISQMSLGKGGVTLWKVVSLLQATWENETWRETWRETRQMKAAFQLQCLAKIKAIFQVQLQFAGVTVE